MQVDLHTHSVASDGVLSPQALLDAALAAGVTLFSITDHDTLAAYDEIGRLGSYGAMRLIPGIELSAVWQGRVVHILGYGFRWPACTLAAGIDTQRRRRDKRALEIGERLARRGIENAFEGASRHAAGGSIGRPHFARYLVETGAARSMDDAFKRWLSDRAVAGLCAHWAALTEAVDWIRADGGTAVLAHPAKYQLTHTRLRELLGDFVSGGGEGLEVICGQQAASTTRDLALSCARFGLMASAGSDFHEPQAYANAPGIRPVLPADLRTLWDHFSG